MGQIDEQWVHSASPAELLAGYAQILRRLGSLKVVRSGNAPVGDYAELLVAQALDGKLVSNFSVKSYDLDCPEFGRVQVKARLVSTPRKSGQLQTSPFRSWDFEHAAFVLMSSDSYEVAQAVILPVDAIRTLASERPRVNGSVVQMSKSVMTHRAAIDITERLQAAARA